MQPPPTTQLFHLITHLAAGQDSLNFHKVEKRKKVAALIACQVAIKLIRQQENKKSKTLEGEKGKCTRKHFHAGQ